MPNTGNTRRIFVVDDEPVIASSLGSILRVEGFNVTTFTDPRQALDAILAQPPDLLIAEVVLPKVPGLDLAITVQENCPTCRVLLLSGQPDAMKMIEEARAKGHDFEVLAKPISPAEIISKIRRELGLNGGPGTSAA